MRKYRKIFALGFQNALEYRFDFIVGLFSMFFPIFIQVNMWIAIYHNSEKSIIYDYTLAQMLSYVVLAGLISKAMSTSVQYEIMGDIKDGGLNKFLVRPINYLAYRIIQNLGGKYAQFLILCVFISIGMLASAAVFSMNYSVEIILLFIMAIFFAVFLKLAMSVMVSTLAFWIGETWAAFMMLDVIINVMSGGIFPLDIFGQRVVYILKYLPFQYTIYFPIQLLTGHLGRDEILRSIIIQIGWIILFCILDKIVWARGMKDYVAVGG